MRRSRTGLVLAITATLFAGVLIGLGNMIHLAATEPAAADHAHHGHHGGAESSDTLATILTLPAHCLFCIDGMVPAPVPLPRGDAASDGGRALPAPPVVVERLAAPTRRLHHCREPPRRLV